MTKLWNLLLAASCCGAVSLGPTCAWGGAFDGFERPTDMPGAVSMVWTGTETLVETSGYADLASRRPISTNDLFWIASNSKAIACALMLRQIDKGLVGLDRPVADYLPEWQDIRIRDGRRPKHAPTVRELMGHTAGLAFFPKMPITQFSVQELAKMAVTNGLDHDVGEYLYSNWGIDVAMAVVERVTGRPWEKALEEEILKPLGMSDTTFFPSEQTVAARLATSYRVDPYCPETAPKAMTVDQLVVPYDRPGTHAEAGGGLFSTAPDLLKFFRMVASRGCLPDGTRLISEGLMREWYGLTDYFRDRKYTFGMDADAARGFVRHGGAYGTDGAANWKRGTARVFLTQVSMWTARTTARRRNWEDYAARWLDVKADRVMRMEAAWFGAKPEASPAENARAIQQAIDDCASTGGDGVVTLPKGVVRTLPYVLKPRVRIECGPDSKLETVAPSARAVEWDFPRTASCHEGLAFADGVTGVLVWGGGDTINLTVGRADLWDHRGGYPWTAEQNYTNILAAVEAGDEKRLRGLFRKETPKGEPRNPYMLPLGRVVVKVPGKTLKRGTLDPFTGLGALEFAEGGTVELAMAKAERTFAMRFPQGVSYEVKSVPATDRPVYEQRLMPVGFKKATVIDNVVPQTGGFRWTLPADEAVWLTWGRKGDELSLKTGRGDKAVVEGRPSFAAVSAASVAQWDAFWREGARIRVPDPVIQRVYDYGMYRFGAMTDPDGVPAGLQGAWLEDDRLVPWNGDYHFNINVQECYSPAFRGGHFAHLRPLFKMVLAWRPRLRENARRFVGTGDGYVLPHSVDDRGVCIGGFWTGTIDHGSTAWVAAMMYRYVKYANDNAFLREDAYDFMKGAMRVYREMMVEKDGALALPLGPSPEWGGATFRNAVGRNPSFQLAAAHRLARDLIDAAARLGEQPDPMWLDVERRLPGFALVGREIGIFEGQPLTESHRHHSHLAGLYPFDTLDAAALRANGVLGETYGSWVGRGTGYWTGWCVPWASILNTHVGNRAAAVGLLHAWDALFCNPGHGSLHNAYEPGFSRFTISGSFADPGAGQVMQMDGQCAATSAVLELMAHETNGKVEFFKGCPGSWHDVSFENLALSDGTRVSGRRLDGVVTISRVK